jgi:uncharacterized DUF497 family protein
MKTKYYDWDQAKNNTLKSQRDISFEEVLVAIEEKRLLAIVKHQNSSKYPNQKVFVVNINSYVYLVPFVEDEEKIFLKTIIPSRKATKRYLLERRKK